MQTNVLLCGVGGQGTVLASKLIAATAMQQGIPVMSAETIGMAQKGGSVFSFLRMGEGIHAPMFGKGQADMMIAFEPAEAVRMLPYLKENGAAIVNSSAIMPVSAALAAGNYSGEEMISYLRRQVKDIVVIDGNKAVAEIGSPKVLNMVLLGAALSGKKLPLPLESVKEVLKRTGKPQFYEMNCKALDYIRKGEQAV